MQGHTWYYRYTIWYYIYIIIYIQYRHWQRQRNTEPPKSLLVSSAHALLRSADQWHDADRCRGSSGRLQWHGAKWWSGHGSGARNFWIVQLLMKWSFLWWFFWPCGDGNPVGRQEYRQNTLQCEMPGSVTAVTVTVTSKEQWISSFASFSRWRPRDIIFGQAQATEHAMNTHRVSFHEWSGEDSRAEDSISFKGGGHHGI